MSKLALVTDSTSSIPKAFVDQYAIHVAPQILIWGDETFLDGIYITPQQFYNRLKTASKMPSTSQVTPAGFLEIFKKLLAQDYEILAVLISEKLSGTVQSARQALEMLPAGTPVEVVDSNTVSMALGFQVLAAARAAADGATLAECKVITEQVRDRTGLFVAVDTLEFLHRGGRIGGASRFLGTALNIKPILEVVNGRVEPIERVRTRARSLERLVELAEERISGKNPVRIAALHASAPDEASQLLEISQKRFEPVEAIFAEVSPVIGTHTGPGTVGLVYVAGL